jgi:trimeric autotransporter adhesin
MKKNLLAILLGLSCTLGFAQNKTLGVGAATLNPNAALHVESPTNNQGFIMPRLTSANRLAMTLGAADIGLLVYDITAEAVYSWDGSSWSETGKFEYPYADTILSAPNNSNLLRLVYAGSAIENVGVAHFENMNANSGFSTLFVRTNSATNGAVDVVVNNATNNNDAIGVTANGKGTAGRFAVNNASNRFAAVYATTNGQMGSADSSAAVLGVTSTAFSAVTGKATGPNGSNGVTGLSSSSNAFSFAVLGSNTGGGVGGMFTINNATNSSNALESSTNGIGGAAKFKVTNTGSVMPALWAETNSNQPLSAPIFGLNTGTGDVAASFKISNASNTFPAMYAETAGTGRGMTIRKTNTAGSQPGLFVSTEGGRGIWADHNGATGNAGIFQIINAANTSAALFAEAVGSGASIWANKDPGESGPALDATHSGTSGNAGAFTNLNASNTSPALVASSSAPAAAFYAQNTGTGNGFAGLFENTNAANTFPPVQIVTAGNNSNALYVNHTGTGGNFVTYTNSNVPAARIDKTGKGFFNGGTQASGADVAEMFSVEGERNEYEPGDVLVISDELDRTVEKSSSRSSTKVAGVYATRPGVVLTERNVEEKLDDLVPMGVIGVIPTKVCLENGAIKRGDLLVTSSKKGHAMKAVPVIVNGVEIYPTGAILGKALENFEVGESGLIKVLVNVK